MLLHMPKASRCVASLHCHLYQNRRFNWTSVFLLFPRKISWNLAFSQYNQWDCPSLLEGLNKPMFRLWPHGQITWRRFWRFFGVRTFWQTHVMLLFPIRNCIVAPCKNILICVEWYFSKFLWHNLHVFIYFHHDGNQWIHTNNFEFPYSVFFGRVCCCFVQNRYGFAKKNEKLRKLRTLIFRIKLCTIKTWFVAELLITSPSNL